MTVNKKVLLQFFGTGIVLLFCGTILFFFDPRENSFYPRCFVYQHTGFLCSGCGSTRSLYLLLHGDVLNALRCNLMLYCYILLFSGWLFFRTKRTAVIAAAIGLGLSLFYVILRNLNTSWAIFLRPI